MKETIDNIKFYKRENADRRIKMKFHGKKGDDWGSRKISEGWHEAVVEKIEKFTNNDSGKSSLTFRIKVTAGEDEGLAITIYAPWDSDFGEKRIAGILAELDMEEAFEKAFPGEISLFEERVYGKIIDKVTSQPCKIFVVEDKKGYTNVTKFRNIRSTEDKGDTPKAVTNGKSAAAGETSNPDW